MSLSHPSRDSHGRKERVSKEMQEQAGVTRKLPRSGLVQPPILNIFQVAIMVDYQHQPGARAPIDAGNPVSDTRKVSDYRYQSRNVILCSFETGL